MVNDIVIAGASRTAIGRLSGTLSRFAATELGAELLRGMRGATGLAADSVDEVLLGQVFTAGSGTNAARRTAIAAGLADTTGGLTLGRGGGSGLAAIGLAAHLVEAGQAGLIVAGGQEAMSRVAHQLPGSRRGQRQGDWTLVDPIDRDGGYDAARANTPLADIADKAAAKYRVTRHEQDAWAAESQQRAETAGKHGYFEDEIQDVAVPQRGGDAIGFARDENPVPGTTAERLAGERPFAARDGTVTAGNTAGPGDGAALAIVTTRARCEALGLVPQARLVAQATVGIKPAAMGIGAVPAAQRCLHTAGWAAEDIDLVELDEMFAAQAIAAVRQMAWPAERVNVQGGAIALGHPIGASGARMLVTLVHGLHRYGVARGLVALNTGGGEGMAMAVERIT